jgi:hypothetical protein
MMLVSALTFPAPAAAYESFVVQRLISSQDGDYQIIQLEETSGNNGQERLTGLVLSVTNRAGITKAFTFDHDLSSQATARRHVTLVSKRLADYYGQPYDYLLPNQFLPTDGGTIDFAGIDHWEFPAIDPSNHALWRDGHPPVTPLQTFRGSQVFCVPCDEVRLHEYYNPSSDHYFISGSQPDIDALESGRIAGWQRTQEFNSHAVATSTSLFWALSQVGPAVPVCRFFIPPASHFLSASASECEEVATRHPEFVLETRAAFYAWLPNQAGDCPPDYINYSTDEYLILEPVYRLWNKRADTNHRFTTSKIVRDEMMAKGWVLEGYGPDGVVMCMV